MTRQNLVTNPKPCNDFVALAFCFLARREDFPREDKDGVMKRTEDGRQLNRDRLTFQTQNFFKLSGISYTCS